MKVEKLIPEVYYSQSRDFSYIGRLFEIIFNYMKTGADCVGVSSNSDNIDATQIELIALTLGFESKHTYPTRDLIYIISSFSHLIKKKGTKEAITHAIKLLMNSQKIKMDLLDDEDFVTFDDAPNNYTLSIRIPSQMTDTILLEDLFDYILPAGVLYRFNRIVPQPKNVSPLAVTPTKSSAYTIEEDTSVLLSSDEVEGGYAYELLTSATAPSDWSPVGGKYYKYDGTSSSFINIAAGDVYAPYTFYERKRNKDVGTIITGTVAESW